MKKLVRILSISCLAVGLIGCATKKNITDTTYDPMESFNRGVYQFNKVVRAMYIKPIVNLYDVSFPYSAKVGVGNFANNLDEVPSTINNVLQGRGRAAGTSVLRLAINSTLGVFGLFDLASEFGIVPQKEDFGQTLANWGYRDSAYLVLPFFGPSTVRDTFGLVGNTFMSVPYYLNPKWRNRTYGVYILNRQYQLLNTEDVITAASVDEYAFVRNAYLQRRGYLGTQATDDELLDEPPA